MSTQHSFKHTFNLPIAIPIWWLVTAIIGMVFTAGITMQKLDYVIAVTQKIDVIQQRQIDTIAVNRAQDAAIQNHEARLTYLENEARKK